MNKDYQQALFLLAFNHSKLILSMWNTLSSHHKLPCVFFITSFLLFSLSFSHFSSLSNIFFATIALEGHVFAQRLINPSMPGCCPTLAMRLFPTCCLLVCRPVVTFSFTAFRERMYTRAELKHRWTCTTHVMTQTRFQMHIEYSVCHSQCFQSKKSLKNNAHIQIWMSRITWIANNEHPAWTVHCNSFKRPLSL